MKPELTQTITWAEFEDCIKQGVEQTMKECELTIGMTLKEAVEKQIPKKALGDFDSVPHYRCPTCNRAVVLYEYDTQFPYCHWCGQSLRYGDAE